MESIQILLQSVVATLPAWGFLSFLLILLWLIASIMGRSLFGQVDEFSSLGTSMLTTFIVITGGEWSQIFESHLDEIGP